MQQSYFTLFLLPHSALLPLGIPKIISCQPNELSCQITNTVFKIKQCFQIMNSETKSFNIQLD